MRRRLLFVEKMTDGVEGEAEQVQGGLAAPIETLSVDRECSRVGLLPLRTHRIGHLVPEDVLASVEQPVVHGDDARHTKSQQRTQHRCR